jgi:hypothetical protein
MSQIFAPLYRFKTKNNENGIDVLTEHLFGL